MDKHSEEILKFISLKFKNVYEILDKQIEFFTSNNIPLTQDNLIPLNEIIFRAFNFLRDIDENFFSKLLRKIFFDVKNLLKFRNEFSKKNRNWHNILEKEFLPSYTEYKKLSDNISTLKRKIETQKNIMIATENELKYFTPKTKEEIKSYNHTKGRYVDAVHYYGVYRDDLSKLLVSIKELENEISSTFQCIFEKEVESILEKLDMIISSKIYQLNHLMWKEAKQNSSIKNYFEGLGIKEINLSSYAKNYIKNINNLKSENQIERLRR